MKTLFKVVSQTPSVAVQKQDGTTINKSTIVLQEIGGKYENQFVATLLGNAALCKFYPNDYVWASLRFSTREYNGRSTVSSDNGQGKEVACQSKNVYQDITVQDIISFSNH